MPLNLSKKFSRIGKTDSGRVGSEKTKAANAPTVIPTSWQKGKSTRALPRSQSQLRSHSERRPSELRAYPEELRANLMVPRGSHGSLEGILNGKQPRRRERLPRFSPHPGPILILAFVAKLLVGLRPKHDLLPECALPTRRLC